jgi:DNA-binding Xre family transcriptional regulator
VRKKGSGDVALAYKLAKIMNQILLSDSELAAAAGLSAKTIKNLKEGKNASRLRTKRMCLDALNRFLTERGHDAVGPEVFG